MKFKVAEDIDAPSDVVWARFTDFSTIEADLSGRGAVLSRVGHWTEPSEGATWRGSVKVRGRERDLVSIIAAFQENERYQIDSRIGGMEAEYELVFLSMRPDMTRVQAVLDLSAKTLSSRLVLQTLKLSRGTVMQRLQGMLARTGNLAEDDYRRAQSS